MKKKLNCKYDGKREYCLIPAENKYPITKDGKLSCKRVKAATVYGSRKPSHIKRLKKNGLCKYIKKCGVKNSKICK